MRPKLTPVHCALLIPQIHLEALHPLFPPFTANLLLLLPLLHLVMEYFSINTLVT